MKSIVIHHTASTVSTDQFPSVDAYHKSQGFPESSLGFYVGYHLFIEKDGSLLRARSDEERGAHTVAPGRDWNADSIGICLAGDFTKEDPTEAQLTQLFTCKDLMDIHSIPIEEVYDHKDTKSTACPGYPFRSYVERRFKASRSVVWRRARYSPQAQLKRVRRALKRSHGIVKKLLDAQLKRLLRRSKML